MKNSHKKIIIFLLLASMLATFSPSPARAGEWGGDMAAALWTKAVNDMTTSIQNTILAQAKAAALRVLQNHVFSLLRKKSGSSASGLSGMIISNFQDFIYSTAQSSSTTVVNDWFNIISAGTTTAEKQYILTPAKNALQTNVFSQLPNLSDYCKNGDPTKAFDSGTSNPWLCWTKAGAPRNDLASRYLQAQALKQAALNMKAESQKTEAIAGQGLVGKKKTTEETASNGKKVTVPAGSDYKGKKEEITMPAAMGGALMNGVTDFGVKVIEYAKSLPEVMVNMVTATITQMVNQGITETFSKIK